MKYSVGQKVKIRSLEWYRDNVNRYGIIECGKYEFFEPMNEYCGKVVTIKRIDDDNYRIDADKGAFCWTDEMIEGLMEEETKPNIIEEVKTYWDSIKDAWIRPEGHVFKDENGNVINTNKIVLEKKKPEYPKTYEECLKFLGYNNTKTYCVFHTYADESLFESLYRLKVCRDAYWKIVGEEMGLGKPWEPDWLDDDTKKYVITSTKVFKTFGGLGYINYILTFPTEEMRDAFYENFKELINSCKELL